MIAAIWSNDPELYETTLGGTELVNQIFIKINFGDVETIVKRFGLQQISSDIYTKSNGHKYICVINKNAKVAINMAEKIKETM